MKEGIETVLDDRDERIGFKFKDADLIGFPLKVVTGKTISEEMVEVKERKSGNSENVMISELSAYIKKYLGK